VRRKLVDASTVCEGGAGPVATLHRLLGSALLGGHVVQKARGTLYNKGTAFVTQVIGVAVIRVWIRPLLPMLLARLA